MTGKSLVAGFAFLLAAGALAGCAERAGEPTAVVYPHELLLNFQLRSQSLKVLAEESLVALLRARLDSSYGPIVGAGGLTRAAIGDSEVLLVGVSRPDSWIARLVPELPVEMGESQFTFFGEIYRDPRDVLYLLQPNPVRADVALFVVIGNDAAAVAEVAARRPRGYHFEHYAVFRGNRRLRFGTFVPGRDGSWTIDAERQWRFTATGDKSTPHFRFTVHAGAVGAEGLERLAAAKEAVHKRVRAFVGERAATLPRLDVYVYPRCSDKGYFTEDTRIAHADPEENAVHLALEDGLDAWDPETVLLLRAALGEPETRALEVGLGVLLSQSWRKQGWEPWAARLAAAGRVLPLAELLNDELLDSGVYDHAREAQTGEYPLRASPLVYEPLAAALVASLVEAWGREAFLARYAEWRPSGDEIGALESRWRAHLARLAERHAEAIARDRSRFPRASGLQKGVNHTFEGLFIRTGYLSRASDESLARVRALGANAVAIVPYTYYDRRDGKASPLPFMRGPGKENDESVIHAGLEAKRLGMTVLLKPQIQGYAGWPGHIAMASAEEWRRFFDYYERWLRHYALVAEMYQFEILSLGVEMVQATAGHEERWREMAARIRELYSGELVYSANWGGEFERLAFWDAFDYVGVDSYYPLSDKNDPSDEELVAGARAVASLLAAVHRRFGKPVLLTEVGFVNSRAPWKHPWEAGDEPAPADQARAFEAMFQALAGQAWCRGMYWWKWPSVLGASHPGDTSHLFSGKPAEGVMAKWFERL